MQRLLEHYLCNPHLATYAVKLSFLHLPPLLLDCFRGRLHAKLRAQTHCNLLKSQSQRPIARMLLVSTLFQLVMVLALPTTELSRPEDIKTIDPPHAVLEKRYNKCDAGETLISSYCIDWQHMGTRCRRTQDGWTYVRVYADLCPRGTFCLDHFFDHPQQAICISILRAVQWSTKVGDSCQGVNSASNVGTSVRMLVDVFDHGKNYAPEHLTIWSGQTLIQEVGPGDLVEGKFTSQPFKLLGGVLTCVRAMAAGRDIFAYIRPDASP